MKFAGILKKIGFGSLLVALISNCTSRIGEYHEIDIDSVNRRKLKDCDNLPLELIIEAGEVMGPSDKFKCLPGESEEPLPQFSSFMAYADQTGASDYISNENVAALPNGYVESGYLVKYFNQTELKFEIIQKLNDEDANLEYKLISLKSEYEGNNNTDYWGEINYSWTINYNLVVVDLYGKMTYVCEIDGFNFIISNQRYFKMIIDQFTGVPQSIIEIDI
ncbi:MAG: hypothetical protein HKO67_08240 [Flavobacteriaceae bacterium]|nr:hypothetical protein [Bacteroidia bacterium]NNL80466.1 hypothetical protein [Flavobacteriaceae bacterium]